MSNHRFRSAAAASLLAFSGSVLFTSSVHASEDFVTIPERTEVKLSLIADMRSGDVKENSEVVFEVEKEVKDEKGNLLIGARTPAYGKVTKSKHRGAFGAPGKLDFTCDYIQMENGSKIMLRANSLSSYGRDNRTATVATAILLAPLALFVHGRDVTVKKGTEYIMYVDKTTSVSTSTAAAPVVVSAAAASAPKISTPGKSVFLTKDGKAYVGTLEGSDGVSYTVKTDAGVVKLSIVTIEKITPVQ